MSKKISFYSENEFVHRSFKPYSPAKNYIPDWYKKSEIWTGSNNNDMTFIEGLPYKAIKQCMPFLDSLTSGYILELWQDVRVEKEHNGKLKFSWFDTSFSPITGRDSKMAELLPVPIGCNSDHYVWLLPFGIKTPPGYSMLMSHPFNRHDLPFTTLTAIVDADSYMIPGGNVPVFFKDGFEGIIPAGTPIVQVLPFKRDNWKSETILDEVGYKSTRFNITKYATGAYKKLMWSKKNFE